MREEDSARRAARRVHLRRGGEQEDGRSAHEIGSLAREHQIFAGPLRDSPRAYIPGEKIFPINTARNGRMNAGKNRRMTNCSGSFLGTFSYSPRFQRIFESAAAPYHRWILRSCRNFSLAPSLSRAHRSRQAF